MTSTRLHPLSSEPVGAAHASRRRLFSSRTVARVTAFGAAAIVLALVFAAYRQPGLMVDWLNALRLCY